MNKFAPGCRCCGGDAGVPSACDATGWPRLHTGHPELDVPTLTAIWSWLGSDTALVDPDGSNERNLGLAGPRDTAVTSSVTITLFRRSPTGFAGGSSLWYDSGIIGFPAGYPRGAHARTTFNSVTNTYSRALDPAWPPPKCRMWVQCGSPDPVINIISLTNAQAANASCIPDGGTSCGSFQLNSSFNMFQARHTSDIFSSDPDSPHYRFRYDSGPLTAGPDIGSIAYDIVDVTR